MEFGVCSSQRRNDAHLGHIRHKTYDGPAGSGSNEGDDQVTTEDRKREIFAQPGAAKEVYAPEGHYVNSHVIVRGPDSLWHLFYAPAYPRWIRPPSSSGASPLPSAATFDHATSKDLLTWTHHGPVVEAGSPGDCDAYEVGADCIIEHEGRWHIVYHCRPTRSSSRRFAMAVSDDLWSWSKYPGGGSPTFIPDRELSGWREEGMMECKDPSIIYQDGRYYMYYVCQKLVEPIDEPLKQTHTGINVATSTDLVHWEDHGAVIEDRWITNPMFGPWGFETPRAVQRDGKVYMFAMYFYGLQYTVGDDPFHFGPWQVVGPWHAPVIFNDDEDRWYITHSMNPFGKLSTRPPKAGPWRGLYIAGLEWSEGVPVPVDLRAVMEDWPWQREGGG